MPIKQEDKKYYTSAGILGGLGFIAHKADKDLSKAQQSLQTWEKSLKLFQDIAAERSFTVAEADKVFDTYSSGGKNIARSRVIGIPIGTGVLGTYRALGETVPNLTRKLIKGKINKQDFDSIQGALEHYKLYSNSKVTASELKSHHIVKGLQAEYFNELKDPNIFSKEILEKLHSPTDNLSNKIEEIKKLSPQAGDIVEKSIIGNKNLIGEAKRLSGNTREVISTPELYMRMTSGPAIGAKNVLKTIKKFTLPVAGVALGIPLLKNILHHEKKAKEKLKTTKTLAMAGIGTAGVLSGVTGIKQIIKPPKNIGVTYGTMSSIGAGHKNPGLAIYEAIKADPRFNKRDIELLERDSHGIFRGNYKHYNTLIDTGLGSELPNYQVQGFNPTQFTHGHTLPSNFKTNSHVRYLTDMVDSEGKTLGATFNYHKPSKPGTMLTYGPNAKDVMSRKGAKVLHVGDTLTPALRQENIDSIYKTPRQSHEVIDDIIEHSKSDKTVGELEFTKLKNLKNKKIISIVGAGRGDYVAVRAKEMHDLLKQHNLHNDYGVIAVLAGGKHEEINTILKDTDVAITGKLPGNLYNELQHSSKINWGMSGTSGMSEALMMKNIQALPKQWGYKGYHDFKTNKFVEEIKPGTIAGKQEAVLNSMGLKGHNASLDIWNKGNLEFALKQPGVVEASSADDIINVLKDSDKLNKLEESSKLRGDFLRKEFQQSKKNMLDSIFKHVKKTERVSRLKGTALALAGVGAAAYGATKLYKTVLDK